MDSDAAISIMKCVIQFSLENDLTTKSSYDTDGIAVVTSFKSLERHLLKYMNKEYLEILDTFDELFDFLMEQGRDIAAENFKIKWEYVVMPGKKYEKTTTYRQKIIFLPLRRTYFYSYNLFVLFQKPERLKYFGTEEDYNILTEIPNDNILSCLEETTITDVEYKYRFQIKDYINIKFQELLNDTEISVLVIGSTSNRLAMVNSDLNLGIRVPSSKIKEGEALCDFTKWNNTFYDAYYLAKCLRDIGMEATLPIPKIKRTRFTEPESGIQCAIGFDEGLLFERDNLISEYLELDKRIKPLIIAVLNFTRAQNINKSCRIFMLSIYSYVFMTLHFLMNVIEKPIIPSIQYLPVECNSSNCFYRINDEPITTFINNKIEKMDVRYHNCVRIINKHTSIYSSDNDNEIKSTVWYSENNDSIGKLFLNFIKHYSDRRSYKSISIVLGNGKLVKFDKKDWSADVVWVQDPFLFKKNIARNCQYNTLKMITRVFNTAAERLQSGSTYQEICDEQL